MWATRWPRHVFCFFAIGLLGFVWQSAASLSDGEVTQVKCAVCQFAMVEASNLIVEMGIDRKVEDEVIDFADNLCTLSKREGRWLRQFDVKDSVDGRLTVENMTEYGECRSECLLLRKACQAALGKKLEKLVDLLRSEAALPALTKGVCQAICKKKLPPLTYKRVDEVWMKGADGGMLQMMENRDKLRQETGQIFDVMKREDMESMSDGDKEAQAAQDAFAEQLRDAREMSGRDWRGTEFEDL